MFSERSMLVVEELVKSSSANYGIHPSGGYHNSSVHIANIRIVLSDIDQWLK